MYFFEVQYALIALLSTLVGAFIISSTEKEISAKVRLQEYMIPSVAISVLLEVVHSMLFRHMIILHLGSFGGLILSGNSTYRISWSYNGVIAFNLI